MKNATGQDVGHKDYHKRRLQKNHFLIYTITSTIRPSPAPSITHGITSLCTSSVCSCVFNSNHEDTVSSLVSLASPISKIIIQSVPDLQRHHVRYDVSILSRPRLISATGQQWTDIELIDLECCSRGAIRGKKRDNVSELTSKNSNLTSSER